MSNYPAAGVGGKVVVGANTAANIDTWTVTPKGAEKETTPFGAANSWQQTTGTIKSWTAKWDGQLDPSDAAQQALLNGLNQIFTIKMYVDATYYWTGAARYTGGPSAGKATDVVTVSYSFTGVGSLVLTS
jgi:hypothetical protein